MKKLTLSIMLICGFACLQANNALGQSNLILNPSFEAGTHPTGSNGFGNGNVSNWGPGYTYNTQGVSTGTQYGLTPDILDYDPSVTICDWGKIPNVFYTTYTGSGSMPQNGYRYARIGGGYTGVYPFFEGESILGEFSQFTCPGNYTLSFWAKAPDGYWQGSCTGYYGFVTYNIHPNNYVQVALRSTSNKSLDRLLYTTPTIVNKGNWVLYTTTVSITASDIATYNRIEFRIDSTGTQGSYTKAAFIDNVSLVYNGPVNNYSYLFNSTINCTESLDLDLINTQVCNGYYDSWRLNGTPVNHIVNPNTNSTYITTCRTMNGCINFDVQVNVTVTTPPVDTIDTFLCYDNRAMLPPAICPQTNVTSIEWKDPNNNITTLSNPQSTYTAQGSGTYEVTTNYNNGCACKTVLNVDMSSPYPSDTLYDTLRCDSCVQIAAGYCPPGSITSSWSSSSGPDPMLGSNAAVTVCPAHDDEYVYTCSDIHGCPTYKSYRKITYQITPTSFSLNIIKVASCGQTPAAVPIGCHNGVPYIGGTYKWYDPNSNFIVETSTPELPYQASGHGLYSAEIYDNHGCRICVEPFDITWYNNMKGYFTDGDTVAVCPDSCAKLYFDYGHTGILQSYGAAAQPFTWSLPGAPVMGADIIDNGDGTFRFCPRTLPVTLRRVVVDPNNPSCILYHQEVTVLLDVNCGDHRPAPEGLNNNTDLESAVTIYPNPISEIFTLTISGLDLSKVTYSITDVTGKVIIEETRATAEKMTINIGQLAKGTYLVNVHYKDSVITKKVLLQ